MFIRTSYKNRSQAQQQQNSYDGDSGCDGSGDFDDDADDDDDNTSDVFRNTCTFVLSFFYSMPTQQRYDWASRTVIRQISWTLTTRTMLTLKAI